MSSLVKWSIAGLAAALIAGGVTYHHATGARFEVRLVPISAPPVPSQCIGACRWPNAWFRGTITNTGHRGSFLTCTTRAYDATGRVVYSGYFGGGGDFAGAAPYVEAGQTIRWTGHLAPKESGAYPPIARYDPTCRSVDYHGNAPG